jgi:signal transduction histidine kinase
MRLADFIFENIEPILAEWEAFARSLAPGGQMDKLALRNDAESILRATVRDMKTAQTDAQQASKSKGQGGAGGAASDELDDASAVHGVGRVGSGFDLNEVVSEYRALRASVLSLWRASNPDPDNRDLADITRFNESIDQSLATGVAAYAKRVDQTRRMFLAILAHDLRNPLHTISVSAHLASHISSLPPDSTDALKMIEKSVQAISMLINDLSDFASMGLGSAMPIAPAEVNFDALCREVIGEIRAANPAHEIELDARGDLTATADAARLRQVIANLVGNAIQHGSPDHQVTLTLTGGQTELVLSVHNHGQPIKPEQIATIFDPLVRGEISDQQRRPGSLGLGLHIVREIVTAHGGTVGLTSSEPDGTRFTVRLPRLPSAGKSG